MRLSWFHVILFYPIIEYLYIIHKLVKCVKFLIAMDAHPMAITRPFPLLVEDFLFGASAFGADVLPTSFAFVDAL